MVDGRRKMSALAELHGCHLMAKALQSYGLWKAVTDLREGAVGALQHASTHGCIIHPEIASDGTDDNLARVQSDSDLQAYAESVQSALRMPLDLFLHTQGGVAGAHSVILVGDGSAEQCHNPIARRLIDGPLKMMDRLHHEFEDRVKKLARHLGVTVG